MTHGEIIDRLRVTRILTDAEYRKVKEIERSGILLTADEIADMFNLVKTRSVEKSK